MYFANYGSTRIELNDTNAEVTINYKETSWKMRGIGGCFARVYVNTPSASGAQTVLDLGGTSPLKLQWKTVRGRSIIGKCAFPEHDILVSLIYRITADNKVRCSAEIVGKGVSKIAEIFFPAGPSVANPSDRLVLPQWLGILVSPEGDDFYVRRTLWLRPWCMRFIGATQHTPHGDSSYIAIVNDSLHRNADIRREKGTLDFLYLGTPSYVEKQSQTRIQTIEFQFMTGNYVQIAQTYKKWVMTQPSYRTFATRTRPCREELIGGAIFFCHIPCDYGGQPLAFDTLIPRLKALKQAGVERAILHVGGWNRKGYDAYYPDIMPANAACGGDEGMRRLTEAIAELGYICTPHDDLGIISTKAPSFNEKWLYRYGDGNIINGGIYRDTQNYMTSGAGQAHFAKRNVPEIKRRYPALSGYLYDVTTSTQPLEDYNVNPPTSMEQDLKDRNEAFKVTREAFAEFTIGESIVDWSMPYNDSGFMAEEGYIHRGDGGWSTDAIHGEIVPMWELVYHESHIGFRDNSTHVNTPMETDQPFLRYLRVLLKTWRAGTCPPSFFSDDLTFNIVGSMMTDPKNKRQPGWSELTTTQFLATVSRVSTWLADNVFHSPMTMHRFVDGDLFREHSQFASKKGMTEVYINTGVTNWSPLPGVVLPPNGFWITGPGLLAYHALQVAGKNLQAATLAAFRWTGTSARDMKGYLAFGSSNCIWTDGHRTADVTITEVCKTVDVSVK